MLPLLLALMVAGDPDASPASSASHVSEYLRLPTLGGMQFWADLRWHAGYRLQRNPVLHVHRLLDPENRLVHLGSREECQERLDRLVGDQPACDPNREVVILAHGLMSFHQTMALLGKHLEKEGGYTVVNFTYPSTQGTVAEHAQALAGVIEHLRQGGAGRIHFVAHSLGNLVVRRYFYNLAPKGDAAGARFGRLVMLAPPNHGARLAEIQGIDLAAQLVGGLPARQLAHEWSELERQLATPPIEFAILAGGLGNSVGFNPLVPGDDDAVVAVDETRLAGARDFARLTINHSGILLHPRAREYTLRFLREGRLRAEGPREPIAEGRR